MNKRRVWLLGGVCLIVIGLLLTLPSFLRQQKTLGTQEVAASAAFKQTDDRAPVSQTAETYIEGKPVRLQIPSLSIDLPVADGVFNATTREWTLSQDKVHYALKTPLANNSHGNTFLYGHNRRAVLRALADIKPGAEAIVTTGNGRQFVYVFTGSYETTPDDDTPFQYSGKPMLTIQTCSGVWYQNRQLFMFDLKEVR